MEPSTRTKLRILLMGLILPVAILYALYWRATATYLDLRGNMRAYNNEYFARYRLGLAGAEYPPVDLVALGESPLKSAFNPTLFEDFFAVNLALANGNALTTYRALALVLEKGERPKCVLFASHYSWRRSRDFWLQQIVHSAAFGWRDVRWIWRTARDEGAYPASEFTAAGFHLAALRSLLRLDSLPLRELQKMYARLPGISEGEGRARRRREMNEHDRYRGFQNIRSERVRDENDPRFFGEMQEQFAHPFQSNESEDLYLRKLAAQAVASGAKFFYLVLPVAESARARQSAEYRTREREHLSAVFAEVPGTRVLRVGDAWPISFFRDFSHLNGEGAERLAKEIGPELSAECR